MSFRATFTLLVVACLLNAGNSATTVYAGTLPPTGITTEQTTPTMGITTESPTDRTTESPGNITTESPTNITTIVVYDRKVCWLKVKASSDDLKTYTILIDHHAEDIENITDRGSFGNATHPVTKCFEIECTKGIIATVNFLGHFGKKLIFKGVQNRTMWCDAETAIYRSKFSCNFGKIAVNLTVPSLT